MKKYTAKVLEGTRILTGRVRLSYPHLFEKDEQSDKYQCQLLIDKDDTETLAVIEEAIDRAKEEGIVQKWKNKLPKNWGNPLHDGSESDNDTLDGVFTITARNGVRRPPVIDTDREPIDDPDEVYGGCYVRASLSFYPYNSAGKQGVGVILNSLQKLEDGDHLGSYEDIDVVYDDDDEEDKDELL